VTFRRIKIKSRSGEKTHGIVKEASGTGPRGAPMGGGAMALP